jgi:hypothetical protein
MSNKTKWDNDSPYNNVIIIRDETWAATKDNALVSIRYRLETQFAAGSATRTATDNVTWCAIAEALKNVR